MARSRFAFQEFGFSNLQGQVSRAAIGVLKEEAEFAVEEAEAVLKDAKDNFIPVDQGDLADSGEVEVIDKGADHVSVAITFGKGLPDPRAIVIHEHPSNMDPPSWLAAGSVNFQPTGRGPEYLSQPLRDRQRALPGRLAARVRNYLRARGLVRR